MCEWESATSMQQWPCHEKLPLWHPRISQDLFNKYRDSVPERTPINSCAAQDYLRRGRLGAA